MKLLITRPVVLTGAGGVRSFVPGITVDVDASTAEQILVQQAGIAIDAPVAPANPKRKKAEPTDAATEPDH